MRRSVLVPSSVNVLSQLTEAEEVQPVVRPTKAETPLVDDFLKKLSEATPKR